ncbi:hypothetical protein [Flavobacterium sp. HJJ]|uniref:hypothetical protein n=1 Tax=Flavobacterium sp. HJJ TaxID=2783792 RepID=UPI00188BDE34|nr:hypothetical protein [Flavobacterium sp. HJJ]MBF4473084.1 hypothetical protein [Flavobacterium sp. HJJ]
MKKSNLLLIIIFVTFNYGYSQEINLDTIRITNQIKVSKKISKDYIKNVVDSEEIIQYNYQNKQLTSIITTSPAGDVIEKETVKYQDNKLNEIHYEYFKYKDIEASAFTFSFEYTNDLITKLIETENGIQTEEHYTYNKLNQLKEVRIVKDKKVLETRKCKYNKKGHLVKVIYIVNNYSYSDSYKSYDTKKNSYELIFPKPYLKLINSERNNVLEENIKGDNFTYDYEYNSDDYPVKIIEKKDNEIVNITTIEYQ